LATYPELTSRSVRIQNYQNFGTGLMQKANMTKTKFQNIRRFWDVATWMTLTQRQVKVGPQYFTNFYSTTTLTNDEIFSPLAVSIKQLLSRGTFFLLKLFL
jgi:hypothetical protein